MDKQAQLVFVILCSFCVLTVVLYYLNYVSIYSYILVFLILVILILVILIKLYNGKGISCIEQRENKPRKLEQTLLQNVTDYLGVKPSNTILL